MYNAAIHMFLTLPLDNRDYNIHWKGWQIWSCGSGMKIAVKIESKAQCMYCTLYSSMTMEIKCATSVYELITHFNCRERQ